MQQRLEAFDRHLQGWEENEPAEYKARLKTKLLQLSNQGISVSPEQLKILVRKDLMKEKFPQRYTDFTDNGGVVPPALLVPDGSQLLNEGGSADSAELLYYILTQGEVFGVPPVDVGDFTASEVHDDDNDGLLEFVDAWHQPLRFYRWPTRLIRPNFDPANPKLGLDRTTAALLIQGLPSETTPDPLNGDPDDPLGRLTSLSSVSLSPAYPNETLYHTPDTFHVPLIVSAGSDGILGLGEPNSADDAERLAKPPDVSDPELVDALTDNITNRNRRAGGN